MNWISQLTSTVYLSMPISSWCLQLLTGRKYWIQTTNDWMSHHMRVSIHKIGKYMFTSMIHHWKWGETHLGEEFSCGGLQCRVCLTNHFITHFQVPWPIKAQKQRVVTPLSWANSTFTSFHSSSSGSCSCMKNCPQQIAAEKGSANFPVKHVQFSIVSIVCSGWQAC